MLDLFPLFPSFSGWPTTEKADPGQLFKVQTWGTDYMQPTVNSREQLATLCACVIFGCGEGPRNLPVRDPFHEPALLIRFYLQHAAQFPIPARLEGRPAKRRCGRSCANRPQTAAMPPRRARCGRKSCISAVPNLTVFCVWKTHGWSQHCWRHAATQQAIFCRAPHLMWSGTQNGEFHRKKSFQGWSFNN